MTLKELQQKREQLLGEARERLDQINANTDESRAAELGGQHDAAMAAIDRIDADIARQQRMDAAEARQNELNEAEERAQRERRPGGSEGGSASGRSEPGQGVAYRDAFYAMIRAGGDVGELTSEERAALRAGVTEERIQVTGTNTAGGYTVPVELASFIDKAMKDWGPMYDEDVTTGIDTSSGNQINIPTIDDTAKVAGAHTEGTQLTDDASEDVVFGQKLLNAFVADTEWVRWSFELAQDSAFNVEQLLGDLLGERLGRKANAWLTTGTGAGQPAGVVTVSTLGKTAASATAIASDELIDLQHSVNAAYRRSPKCRWMFADTVLQAIRKLKDGQGNYLWQMGNVQVGAPDLLLGKPYSINDDMASIATGQKSVLFGDFGRYYVRRVGSPVIGVVRERFWPDLGIAGLIRLDGEIGQGSAIKYLIQA